MQRLILVYGGIAGVVITIINTLSYELGIASAWLGYLVMFIAFSTIHVAIKQYRDNTLGGIISFGNAALLGLGITAVASILYVVIWELYLVLTDYAFASDFATSTLNARREAGASDAELLALRQEMDQFAELYANPLFRLPVTLSEIFPVGLLISLVSAGVLRKR